ncbi:MAG: hypothetical protein HYU68_05370 [Bacteroidetes bacterium]|nr:hypothetical protein [Bacteroidota bacterium]
MDCFAYYIEEYEKKDKIWQFIIKWAVEKNAVIEIKHSLFWLDHLKSKNASRLFRKNFDIKELIINEAKYILNGKTSYGNPLKVFYTYSNINPPNRNSRLMYLFPKLLLRYQSNSKLNNKLLKSKNFTTCEWEDNFKDLAFYKKIDSTKPLMLCNDGVIYLMLNKQDLELFNTMKVKLFFQDKKEIDHIVLLDY